MRKQLQAIASIASKKPMMPKLSSISRISKTSKISIISALSAILAFFAACTIEPPLHLPGRTVDLKLSFVITSLDVVWNVGVDWRNYWYYGWDDEDMENWGPIGYPEPTYFDVRRFFTGNQPLGNYLQHDGTTIYEPNYRNTYNYGYYDLLIWSNIDSEERKQTVIIDESDITAIMATTSRGRVSYRLPAPARADEIRNVPEVFYDGHERGIYISSNPDDYDYYDEELKAWVKQISEELRPVVYIYLVQVIIYNNSDGSRRKITAVNEDESVSGLANGVNLHTTVTTETPIVAKYPVRMKYDLQARDQRKADIIGGRLTTFGLCGMQGWTRANSPMYAGTRGDLTNNLFVNFKFSNATDSTFVYDITDQLQRQCHGGIITIEVDADTITPPNPGTTGQGSGFEPYVEDYADSLTWEISM